MKFVDQPKEHQRKGFMNSNFRRRKRWIECREAEVSSEVKKLRDKGHEVITIGSQKRVGIWVRVTYLEEVYDK
jgi:hypothetical protein